MSELPAGSFEPGSKLPAGLADAVSAWSAQDPDPDTRGELASLLDQIEAGSQRVPRGADRRLPRSAAVRHRRSARSDRCRPEPDEPSRRRPGGGRSGRRTCWTRGSAGGTVIIGHDARHKSDVFARDSAEIFAGAGFRALLVPVPTPTPVVAFGIGHFGCVAGVVVTASHNPPQDNGYKVYLGDGSQIVPPADGEIAARIEEVTRHDLADVPRSDDYIELGEELVEAYLDRVVSLVPADAPRTLALGLHPAARGRRAGGRRGRRPCRLHRRRGGGPAGRTRSRLPHGRRSPTRRSRARSTWRWPWPSGPAPTWWWRTTPTPTAARSPRRSTAPGGCCAATSSGRCSATTPCAAGSRARTPARSSPARCWRRWPPPTGSRSRRR